LKKSNNILKISQKYQLYQIIQAKIFYRDMSGFTNIKFYIFYNLDFCADEKRAEKGESTLFLPSPLHHHRVE